MSNSRIAAPEPDEYAPYYQRYLDLLPEGDVLEILDKQMHLLLDLLLGLTDDEADFRYAEGKWSIKEVIGHMIDTERVFAFRALSFARGETAALPGYDENIYVDNADFAQRTRGSLSGEYEGLRKSNLFLYPSFGADVQLRRGIADGKEMSVRAIPWIMAGHERHHFSVLNERYLPHL